MCSRIASWWLSHRGRQLVPLCRSLPHMRRSTMQWLSVSLSIVVSFAIGVVMGASRASIVFPQESDLVGTWQVCTTGGCLRMNLKEGRRYQSGNTTGSWRFDGGAIILSGSNFSGQPDETGATGQVLYFDGSALVLEDATTRRTVLFERDGPLLLDQRRRH